MALQCKALLALCSIIILIFEADTANDHVTECAANSAPFQGKNYILSIKVNGQKLCLSAQQDNGNSFEYAVLKICEEDQPLQLWKRNNLAVKNIGKNLCLTTLNSESASYAKLLLQQCDSVDFTQNWDCNYYQESPPFNLLLPESSSFKEGLAFAISSKTKNIHPVFSSAHPWEFKSDIEDLFLSRFMFCFPDELPTCNEILPGIHSSIEKQNNSNRSCFNLKDKLLLKCDKGYTELGHHNQTTRKTMCLGGNRWSGGKMHCIRRSCGQPKTYAHAFFYGEGHSFGDVISYSCDLGYETLPAKMICDSDGQWIGQPPNCNLKCYEEIIQPEGVITSPGYPSPYSPHTACRWVVTVPLENKIAIWIDDFQLEPGSILSQACVTDFLALHDWVEPDSDHLAYQYDSFCGTHAPIKWQSKTNKVQIDFHSDSILQFRGFKLTFSMWNTTFPEKPLLNTSKSENDEKVSQNSALGLQIFVHSWEVMYAVLISIGLLLVFSMLLYQVCWSFTHFHQNNSISPEEDIDRLRRRDTIRRGTIVLHGQLMNAELDNKSESETSEESTEKEDGVETTSSDKPDTKKSVHSV